MVEENQRRFGHGEDNLMNNVNRYEEQAESDDEEMLEMLAGSE